MSKFELTKVKKLKGVGMEISYTMTEETADTKTTNKYNTQITEQPTNELLIHFQDFGCYLEETLGTGVDGFLETEEVKLMGKGNNQSLIIKGKYYTANDLQGTIITPRLRLFNDTFGFELRMQRSWEDLAREVEGFLFDGKRGEVESFN